MKIIGEISGNHKHSFDHASKLIMEAQRGGFTHVKFQTLVPQEITVPLRQEKFRITDPTSLWCGQYLIDLYEETAMSFDLQERLIQYCHSIGMNWFSSPFSTGCVEFLEAQGCPLYKIASFEATDKELIDAIAQTNKPVIISTGGLSEAEIANSLSYFRSISRAKVELLYCVSSYPAKPKEFDIYTPQRWSAEFDVEVGLSDHSEGILMAPIYAAMGCNTIEKHIKLEGDYDSIDAEFSLSSEHFLSFTAGIREAHEVQRDTDQTALNESGKKYHRSYYYRTALSIGTKIEPKHLISLRPSSGLSTFEATSLIGRKLSVNVEQYDAVNVHHTK